MLRITCFAIWLLMWLPAIAMVENPKLARDAVGLLVFGAIFLGIGIGLNMMSPGPARRDANGNMPFV